MDDALSMVFLFATLPTNEDGVIGGSRVGECQKLAAEFQAYIAHNRCLKKVFVSVKGIYYQAEIRGQEITWIVPHQFTQHVKMTKTDWDG